ncbi:MAG: hypothetical protein NT128_00475 [Proteobacteria bacterium]|nr:hypothetical protein [Pseudomonadota bacterium]
MKVFFGRAFLFCLLLASTINLKALSLQDIFSSSSDDPNALALAETALKKLPSNNFTIGYVAIVSGTAAISNIIELSTLSKWSHTAMILCPPEDILLPDCTRDIMSIDKTNWLCLDVGDLGRNCDVHLVPWSTFIEYEKCASSVALRPFWYQGKPMPTNEKLHEVINPHIGKPFKKSTKELIYAAFRWNNAQDLESFFCCELTAHVLQDLGLLSKSQQPNNYVSADFCVERSDSLELVETLLGEDILVHESKLSRSRKIFHGFLSIAQSANRYFNKYFYK